MIPRFAAAFLEALVRQNPAVALLGPRQVGKTTLAIEIASHHPKPAVYVDLELPSDRAKLADPEGYLNRHENHLVILDEIQQLPEVFRVLRGLIDRRKRAGHSTAQFLLLGSASISLLQQSSESLAGRIAYLELNPLNIVETVPKHSIDALWIRGGFPNSFLAATDNASFGWRKFFMQAYLERDIPALGGRIPAATLQRFWTMLAYEQGSMLNASRIAGSLGISGQSVTRYLDLLVDLLLVRRLEPWLRNVSKRMTRSPKVYIRDSGLVHALLGLRTVEDVLSHPVAGSSWEGFVIENILGVVPVGTQAYFYRTAAGAEIDLVLEIPGNKRWAIEIKRSLAPSVSKGFHIGCADIEADEQLVIYPGSETYSLGNHTQAVGLVEAIQKTAALNDMTQ